jgi:hypothetical protein
MKIEVSIGEIADKYTILKLKMEFIKDTHKFENVKKEYEYIRKIVKKLDISEDLMMAELQEVNRKLWAVEDAIRACEYKSDFGQEFIDLAREVYKLNDVRAIVKKSINSKYDSKFVEEKSYKHY